MIFWWLGSYFGSSNATMACSCYTYSLNLFGSVSYFPNILHTLNYHEILTFTIIIFPITITLSRSFKSFQLLWTFLTIKMMNVDFCLSLTLNTIIKKRYIEDPGYRSLPKRCRSLHQTWIEWKKYVKRGYVSAPLVKR